MPLEPGQKLSHYHLVEKIGEGGMGVVWRARDEKLRRDVALKVLPAELVEDPERRRRLLREARSAAAINHPNVGTVYEVDEAQGIVFIAMELVQGETLRSLHGGRPMAIPETLRIATALAEGLVAAHGADVVHRDLKPENVLVRPDGVVKIL
ncbi:MAG: serine/threonine-protein kinase, partial [Dehalococcoidia bacterium]